MVSTSDRIAPGAEHPTAPSCPQGGLAHDLVQGRTSPERPLLDMEDRWLRKLDPIEMGRILFDRLLEQSPGVAAGMLRACGARITAARL